MRVFLEEMLDVVILGFQVAMFVTALIVGVALFVGLAMGLASAAAWMLGR
jgi:ABC-type dipeptide/oligopeptide/nickel transport system permease subunit